MKTLEQAKQDYLAAAKSRPLPAQVVRNRADDVLAGSESPFPFCYSDPEDLAWAKEQGHKTYTAAGHDWVVSWPRESEQYLSATGGFYSTDELPENNDDVVTQLYSAEVKAERNARLNDSDPYAQLSDITVQREEGGKREPLTDDERAQVRAYRQALRDLTDAEGFPFVEFPEIPECVAYELEQKIARRASK